MKTEAQKEYDKQVYQWLLDLNENEVIEIMTMLLERLKKKKEKK